MQFRGVCGEPEAPAERTQRLHVALGLVAEGEVLPHDHGGGVQPVDEDLVHELVRRQPGQLRRERQHGEHVHAQLLDQLSLAPQRGQLGGVGAWSQYLGGMRIESQHNAGQPAIAGGLHRFVDQSLVPAMHPVEDTDRDDAPAPAARQIRQTTPTLHTWSLAADRAVSGRQGHLRQV